MDNNPQLPQNSTPSTDGEVLYEHAHPITKTPTSNDAPGAQAAIDVIREKLARIYAEEPNTAVEQQEAAVARPRSKHQQFMYDLSTSGRSLPEIQAAWHAYYAGLPDIEKHEVWCEFYEASGTIPPKQHLPSKSTAQPIQTAQNPLYQPPSASQPQPNSTLAPTATKPRLPELPNLESLTPAALRAAQLSRHLAQRAHRTLAPHAKKSLDRGNMVFKRVVEKLSADKRQQEQIRETIRNQVALAGKLKVKHHLQSLAFGLAMGTIAIVIFLFSFFNEVIITPFIQPGNKVGATPIIIDPNSVAPTSQPEIIIPKINLEIPVDYNQTSDDENVIQGALNNGIVHYPSTSLPGQAGNAAYFGHSSNNILNPGKYKFAFVLLHEVQPGDTFYITHDGKVYIYKVFSRQVVDPSDVAVLNPTPGHPATATLITCDPPGTVWHRLVVVGDQISPDPTTISQTLPKPATAPASITELPDNGPSWWQQLWNSIF